MPLFRFRRDGGTEMLRKITFLALIFAVGFLIAENRASDTSHEERVDGLESRVAGLETTVVALVGDKLGTPTSAPLTVVVPADPATGRPERVVVVPAPTTSTTSTGETTTTTRAAPTTAPSTTPPPTTAPTSSTTRPTTSPTTASTLLPCPPLLPTCTAPAAADELGSAASSSPSDGHVIPTVVALCVLLVLVGTVRRRRSPEDA